MALRFLHISRSLVKQLDLMRKKDKKAELAALKCETILDDIKLFGCQAKAVAGKRTRNGEQRIRNCVKYDLGRGYRLITIRRGCHLLVPFAGTHDEVDQWIERHRHDDFAPDETGFRCEKMEVLDSVGQDDSMDGGSDAQETDTYEEALLKRLDEASLKAVFQGFFLPPSGTAGSSGSGDLGD